MVRRGQPDPALGRPARRPKPGGGPWTVGVLVSSAADTFAAEQGGPNVRVVRFDGATDAMTAVQNGQYDATLQDLPAARFYASRFPGLELVGPPESHGYYVIYVRSEDQALRDALDQGIARLIASGDLRRLYESYGIWTEAQDELTGVHRADRAACRHAARRAAGRCSGTYLPRLLDAACVTIVLSVTSMPLAMVLGLFDRDRPAVRARGRCSVVLAGYVELIRGTPLMLQLFVLFYLLRLPPWVAGDRRAGDQLFGLRGRDLPRGAPGDPARPDGGRAGAGDVAAAWRCGG